MTFALSMTCAFLVPSAASASPQPAVPQSAQQACGSTEFCAWSAAGFGGNKSTIIETQYCQQIYNGGARSYVNNSNLEGRLFESPFCGGLSYPVTYDSSSRDIGFQATTFQEACVSCRSGG